MLFRSCQRGREDGEVIALLREGLADAKRTRHIDAIDGEFIAIDTALARYSGNRAKVAGILGISERNIYRLIKQYELGD